MAQTIKLKRSSVSGNTPSTSDLELGEVAINTYDGKMFIKKNDGSDSIVEIGGSSGTVTEAFKTIAVSGQSSVVADSATDTLTLVAGSNMTITTNASGDTITFASSGGGGSQNLFSTFAVSGQNNVVADSTTDTLTFVAGTGITLTTDASNDQITITNSATGANAFGNIAVSGQSTVAADSTNDTLTLTAGSGITLTTDASNDAVTIAATASAITVQDEGSALSTAATTLNFVGAGVTASGTGATKTITISGGGGSQNVFSNIGVSGQGTIQADATTDTLTFEAGTGISLTTDTTNDKLTITATGGTSNVANAASSIKEFKYDITTSTTTLTGSDANSNTLAYEAGAIQVFLNGILLDPATDYTASNGTSVVLTDAAVNGDDVQILAFNRKIVTANVGLSTFTGDGTTTAFTLSSDPVHENNTRVHIDGVYQEKAAYSISGTTLTFSGAPPNGSSIEVEIGFTQAEIGSTLDFADNAILRIGTGNDLQILHDGSNSIIKDTGTGDLQIAASTLEVKNSGLSETMLKAIEDGAVELYFDNSKKLETVTGGVTITGTATATTFSGDLSGTINAATTGTTQSASDNSTKIATTAYVDTAVTNLVDSAPGTLNTLNELAAALGDDANFSTTITNSLATKVGLTATTGAANIPAGTTGQRPGSPAAGQFRYNSTLNQFEGYTSSWGAIGGGGTNTFTTNVFTGDGSTTAFTLSQAVSSVNDCIVHVGGIYQVPTDAYTVSGTTLTFTSAPANTRKIVVYSVKAGVSGNNLNVQTINGNGSDHTFTLNVNPINENNTIVHIDGVYQQKSSYTVSGTSLSFGNGNIPANGTVIEVATFTQTEINVPVNDTIDTVHIKDDAVTSAKLGGNLVTPGTLDVNGAEFILDADADTSLTADTDDQIDIKIGGTDQIKLIDGAILPVTTNDIDLGSTSLEFKNAYFDGTVTSDAFAGPLTGDVTGNVSGTAATVTGAAQTNITSVGTLTGLTVSGSIQASTAYRAYDSANSTYRNVLRYDSGNVRLETGTSGSAAIGLFTAGSEAMHINSSGNVIINKANFSSLPTGSKLNIFGDGTTLRLDGTSATTKSILFRNVNAGNPGEVYADGSLRFRTEDASTRITFHTNSSGSNNERMRIDEYGKVGIGVTPPPHSNLGELLSVNCANLIGVGTGGGYVGYNSYYNSGWKYQLASASVLLSFENDGDFTIRQAGSGSANGAISYSENFKVERSTGYLVAQGASQVRLVLGNTGNPSNNTSNWIRGNSGSLDFNSASSGFNWEIGGNAKVKINSSGNLGIGAGHDETRRNLGLKGSTPGVVFYDTNITNLTHEIVGGGNAGLEYSADYQNVADGYHRFDIGGAEKLRITEKSAIIQKGGTAQYVQGGEFCSFNSGTYICSSGGDNLTDRGLLQLHSSVSSGTGTVYIACENSGQNVVWGYIIDFFFSNNSFSHTIRETGNSQNTTTPSMYVDASRNVYLRISYVGGLGGNIKVTAAGHVVCTNY